MQDNNLLDDNMLDLMNLFLRSQSKLNNKERIDKSLEIQKLLAISLLSNLILSKKIFKRNALVAEFVESHLGLSIKKYMLNSRILIVGKLCKELNEISEVEKIEDILNLLYNIYKKIELEEDIFSKDIYDVIKGMKL